MREDVIQIVQKYIDAVRKNEPANLPLDPNVVFESPLGRYEGIAAFEKGLADFVSILKEVRVLHLTADDENCAAALEIDTVFGLIPFLEYFNLRDGKIISIRAYYDPRPLLEGMSRMRGR